MFVQHSTFLRTQAVDIARVKDAQRRQELFKKALDQQLSVRQIRELASGGVSETQQSDSDLEQKFGCGFGVAQPVSRSP
jgi:hypothetical protein